MSLIAPPRCFARYVISSNNEWVIPAGVSARRFTVLDVPDSRKGDRRYFGSVVNIASRVADRAGPGEILVTARIANLAAGQPGLHFEDLGPAPLKHISAPVRLDRVTRSD